MIPSERARFRRALAASAGLHVAAVGLLWAFAGTAEPLPKMRVYAVDIVSPPPQLAGPPNPGNGAAPSVAEPEPRPATPAAPKPAAPEPQPPPPEAAPPKPEAKPVSKPAPKPPERNEKAPAKPAAKEPAKPAPAKKTSPEKSSTSSKSDAKPSASKSDESKPKATKPAGGGEGGGSGASRGAKPDATSSGGEGLDIHLRGMQCPSPDYCANIIRQLYRYFRPPSGASTDQAEVFFYINRDGTVDDIRVLRSAGSFQFRIAAMEAVEQAGLNKAFGALPRSFSVDRLPVSFFFRPAR